ERVLDGGHGGNPLSGSPVRGDRSTVPSGRGAGKTRWLMRAISATDTAGHPGSLPWPVDLGRLDLNLLVALDALLEQRSVTRAAAQMGLSQPALSASLARLRRHFDDELLTRAGNSYRLTPLA